MSAVRSLSFVCLVFFLISCSTTSPWGDLVDSRDESFNLAYKKAHDEESLQPQQSCATYTKLAQENRFRLQELALLRAHLICQEPKALPTLPEDFSSKKPWFAALNADRLIREAKLSRDNEALTRAYLERARVSSHLKEKVSLLQESARTAQLTKNEALIEEAQARLSRSAPRFQSHPKDQDLIRTAIDFFSQRDFVKGRKFLNQALQSRELTLEQKYQARKLLRNSFKTEQNREQYLKAAGSLVRWTQAQDRLSFYHEAALTYIRALWTDGKIKEAQQALARTEKKLKGQFPLDELYFVRGRMAEEAQDYNSAIHFYSEAEKESLGKNPLQEKIMSYHAWSLKKLSRFQEASDLYRSLRDMTQDPFDRSRYTFWYARSLEGAGLHSLAQDYFRELTKDDPLGFYGVLAHRELHEPFPALEPARKQIAWSSLSLERQDQKMIADLQMVEENTILEKFLDDRTQWLKNKNINDEATWLFMMKSYARAGLYLPLFSQIGSLTADVRGHLLLEHPELVFPMKYLELIRPAAEKFSVRPELMMSIIRQESAFDPEARSSADAFGLMQVLPSVAISHQKYTGIQIQHHEDLFKPEVNIPVGASLLGQLSKKYRGQFILITAAYNANEKAIQTWLKTRLGKDPLEFIEDIPYEETRAYVKLVLRNFVFYSRLEAKGQIVPFPEWCLQDLQSFKTSTDQGVVSN